MRKYYFAYHSVNGIIFPFMWVEDDGHSVGGRPKIMDGTAYEISEEDFERGDLLPLQRRHPIPMPDPTSD